MSLLELTEELILSLVEDKDIVKVKEFPAGSFTDVSSEVFLLFLDFSNDVANDYIEFEFGDYEDEDYETLPYKDFKFFINDYSVTFYSPQMKDLQQKVEQLEKENEYLKMSNPEQNMEHFRIVNENKRKTVSIVL